MAEESQPETKAKKEDKDKESEKKPEPLPERSETTEHAALIGGKRIRYSATAAITHMKADDGTVKASIFTVAYTKLDEKDKAARPITFAFNGGPGSSSVWLHMGCLGPKRIPLAGDGLTTPPAPYRLSDNEQSILDLTDIVFIDPVSTGWSRPVKDDERKEFHGLKEDTQSVGDLIRLWVTRNGRWASPKYLAGESYGTTRAASLSGYLQDRHGMYLNGISLISAVLMFQTLVPTRGNDIAYALYLPSYAAAAWYHGKVKGPKRTLKAHAEEAVEFALRELIHCYVNEGRTRPGERDRVRRKIAALTGLSERFVDDNDLRVPPHRFFKELLRERRRTIGRYDARFVGVDPDSAGEAPTYDPSYPPVHAPYVAALNSYLRDDLRFELDLIYEALAGEKVRPWKWGEDGENRYVDVASTLRKAIAVNPNLKVFLASGYYDLATAFAAAEWTMDQLRLEPTQKRNVMMKRYPAGHMMYTHEPSLAQLKKDLAAFYK